MIGSRRRRRSVVLTAAVAACLVCATAGCGKKEDKATPVPHDARTLIPPALPDSTTAQADSLVQTEAGAGDAAGAAGTAVPEKISPLTPAPDESPSQAKPTPRPAPQTSSGPYVLQLGSFRRAGNAEEQVARLQALGYDARIEVAVLGGQTYHRVSLVGLESKEEARRLGEKIRADLGIAYLIRRTD